MKRGGLEVKCKGIHLIVSCKMMWHSIASSTCVTHPLDHNLMSYTLSAFIPGYWEVPLISFAIVFIVA